MTVFVKYKKYAQGEVMMLKKNFKTKPVFKVRTHHKSAFDLKK